MLVFLELVLRWLGFGLGLAFRPNNLFMSRLTLPCIYRATCKFRGRQQAAEAGQRGQQSENAHHGGQRVGTAPEEKGENQMLLHVILLMLELNLLQQASIILTDSSSGYHTLYRHIVRTAVPGMCIPLLSAIHHICVLK